LRRLKPSEMAAQVTPKCFDALRPSVQRPARRCNRRPLRSARQQTHPNEPRPDRLPLPSSDLQLLDRTQAGCAGSLDKTTIYLTVRKWDRRSQGNDCRAQKGSRIFRRTVAPFNSRGDKGAIVHRWLVIAGRVPEGGRAQKWAAIHGPRTPLSHAALYHSGCE
jgi:hypothetical protein